MELKLGQTRASRRDYAIAEEKVKEYRARNAAGGASLADTTGTFDRLLALDADFARHDFDNEMLQYRDVDVRLKPLYKFRLAIQDENMNTALSRRYENPLIERFSGRIMRCIDLNVGSVIAPTSVQNFSAFMQNQPGS